MAEVVLAGAAASPGLATGPAHLAAGPAGDAGSRQRDAPASASAQVELAQARAALAAAGDELEATAVRLRGAGRTAEADIVAAGALMALDPALDADVERRLDRGPTVATALLEAAEAHAARIAALADPRLAERADDVRSVGRRAARLAAGTPPDGAAPPPGAVVVADDLGPADVADLDDAVAGILLARGGITAHAAIIARSLGIPMVVGLGPAVLETEAGDAVVVDGDRGTAVLRPGPARVGDVRMAMADRAARRRALAADARRPSLTTDGSPVHVLVNAAGAAEVRAGLAAGAEGVGLLRTELSFLEADRWPDEAAHARLLQPVLEALGPDRPVTVRVLDFGGDKTPPFLAGTARRGLELLLSAPDAARAQLRALARAAPGRRLRVLLPLVESAGQLAQAVALLQEAAAQAGVPVPPVGAMVETPAAAAAARELAAASAFLSIGTNDLVHATLGTDRFRGAGPAAAHHPEVLAHIAATVDAAAAAGIPVEVCGESASDPVAMPLLVGLGVDELSVGAARVGTVRSWVRALSRSHAADLARVALACDRADDVRDLVGAGLAGALHEGEDAAGELVDRAGRVGTLGLQP